MINHLSIKDFAIIDNMEIDFHRGLNILTGETGAGKSIIIEAVSLALGSRADTAFVRTGKNKAVIQLAAEDKNGREYVITREILATGKSTSKVNGELVTLAQLSSICKNIADIHGQYDHQSLLNPDFHGSLVDAFDSASIYPMKDDVSEKFQKFADARRELAALKANLADRSRRRDFMSYELNEIDAANLVPGEDETLTAELALLQNSEKIIDRLSTAYELLYSGDNATVGTLSRSMHLIREVSSFSHELLSLSDALEDINYALEDITASIRRQRENIELDPGRIDSIISRIDTLDALKRKYGPDIPAILAHRDRLASDLEQLDQSDDRLKELENKMDVLRADLYDASVTLSMKRKASAIRIEEGIDAELAELNFKDASLRISFSTDFDEKDDPVFTENGIDRIEFLISANKGEAHKPLAKIASGGEISRIMLAFKGIIGDYDEIPAMIFDEIDSGISGLTASIVGRKLYAIARKRQVICITHLPQIAATGDHNYRIFKQELDGRTSTGIEPLSDEGKVEEIARMLAGMNVTEHSIRNAEELVRSSRN